MELIEKANRIHLEEFGRDAWFGRCIFLSWYCELGTCKFCFRSTTSHQIRHASKARRSDASVITDAIIGSNLGWDIEFLTGGYGIFDFEKIVQFTKWVSEAYGKKIWINLGALKPEELEQLKPYVEGVCASIETAEQNLHDEICPDKPIEPYTEMLGYAQDMGFKTAMTIVIGLGEKREDFEVLAELIEKNDLERITFYALKPVKGTPFTRSPEPNDYAWWIANTRIRFPKLKIMAGLTPKKVDYTNLILRAGANGITKFPAINKFNTEQARMIEKLVADAGREFNGSLTRIPDINWEEKVKEIDCDEDLKGKVREFLERDLRKMSKRKIY
ncbi:MAG: radical SAM protein [Nanobdellota archaeon]